MSFRLSVAHDLGTLAQVLGRELALPLADPFATEIVVVPGDGVRAWLTGELARSLGATDAHSGDGVVANVRFSFPTTLVRLALGDDVTGAWSVGPLTFTVYELLVQHGERLGQSVDLLRARSIADLFDRYTLHRPAMVRGWESGSDIDAAGQPLPAHLGWQPELWRLLKAQLGGRSDAQALAEAARQLRAGELVPEVPERVFLFGLVSLPSPHLAVLSALATRCDVHVLAPTPSIAAWRRVIAEAREPLALPVARTVDPTAASVQHPLAVTWSRAAREAHLLMGNVAIESGATPFEVPSDSPVESPRSLLQHVQAGIRADDVTPPVGLPALDVGDRSVWWHRCHGIVRQAEVLRDELLRVVQTQRPDGELYQPRDIAVLCPDPVVLGPIIEAVFAGDPSSGVPSLPVQIADRSLLQQNPLFDALAALLDLLDGRFRATEVLAYASLPAVRRRFELSVEQLGQVIGWAQDTNARWGLDGSSHAQYGLPDDLHTYTWQAALDQLLVGAAMADSGPRLGPGDTVPYGAIEGDAVDVVGAFAELIYQLGVAHCSLAGAMAPMAFAAAVSEAADALMAVPDADSWQWRDLTGLLDEFANHSTAGLGDLGLTIPTSELSALLAQRLKARPGRVRFATGSITVSSLTAQRGVPHPVVCLIGLDGDLGGAGTVAADDLTAQPACVGDRDARSELRAQLLDAVLAAGERLVICSSGHDLRTNGPIPPVVPMAEFCDLIDVSVTVPVELAPTARARRASEMIATDHPRQAWSDDNFVAGSLHVPSPWSFDVGACRAAVARGDRSAAASPFATTLPPQPPQQITVAALIATARNPVETLVRHRLDAWLERDTRVGIDDLVPLISVGLEAWGIANSLLEHRIASGDAWSDTALEQWAEVQRRTGALPPAALGGIALRSATATVDGLFAELQSHIGGGPLGAVESIPIDVQVGAHIVTGVVPGVRGSLIIDITPSRLKPDHHLAAWVRLAALSLQYPDREWEAVVIATKGSGSKKQPTSVRLRLTDASAAAASISTLIDLHVQARTELIPALAATSESLARHDVLGALSAWSPRAEIPGDNGDRWLQFALGTSDLDDLLDPASPAFRPSLQPWCDTLWGAYRRAVVGESAADADGDSDD